MTEKKYNKFKMPFIEVLLLTFSSFSRKSILFLFIFLMTLINQNIHSQDGTFKEVSKKRNILFPKIENGFFHEIDIDSKLGNRFIFTILEKQYLLLLQEKYNSFLKLTIEKKGITIKSEYSNYYDILYDNGYLVLGKFNKITIELEKALLKKHEFIKSELEHIELSNDEREYIMFFLENASVKYNQPVENKERIDLHKKARLYMNKYPNSEYSPLVKHAYGYFLEPSAFALDLNFGFGIGKNYGNLSKISRRTWGLDLDMKIYFHSFFFGLRGEANYNNVYSDISFNDVTIPEDNFFYISYYDLNIGRKIDFYKRVSILPFIGYGFTEFYFFNFNKSNFDKIYTRDWKYGMDININVPKQERQRTHTSRHSRELSKGAWYFRINIVLHESGIAKISEELRGKSLSINFGFGIHLRGEKSSILLNSL